MDLNKVFLAGRLARDPELRNTQGGASITKFSVATGRKFKSKNGEWQQETDFIDCTAFGKTAEVIDQHFSKGKPIFVEGRMKLDSWKTQDGQNRYKLGVIAERIQFVGPKGGEQQQRQQADDGGWGADDFGGGGGFGSGEEVPF